MSTDKKPGGGKGPMGPGPGHGGMPIEKAKNFKHSFGRLMSYLGNHKVALIFVIVYGDRRRRFFPSSGRRFWAQPPQSFLHRWPQRPKRWKI